MPLEKPTLSLTLAQSVSGLELPFGVQAQRNGLVIPEGLSFDQWKMLGTRLLTLSHSVLFLLGDWLAYGEFAYRDNVWGKQLPAHIYEEVAEQTGFAEQTLADAKWICSKVDLSRRRDGLTLTKLREIVGGLGDGTAASQIDYWQERAVKEHMTVARLRTELRLSKARHRDDPVPPDDTAQSKAAVFEFVRFYEGRSARWGERFKDWVAKQLDPVFEDLRPHLAKKVQKVG